MSITIDIPKNIDRVPEMCSRKEHVDKVPLLKQMLWNGVESYLVDQYSGGRIIKEKLAEMPSLDIYDVNELLEKYHVKSSIAMRGLPGELMLLGEQANTNKHL